ncbi:uncharacterized protein LOC109598801 [Aethina tumida]|uniref:uncharacterized protein LOC109598801 n=1 Tax=Aethina tumida TaxID=116153 RepID=UPI002148F9E8|nr:uncharacterized protein LOC109598801 [Aethina tumida]
MKDFKSNHCRLCTLVFCCVQCRLNHEKSAHNLTFPECDFCLYGIGTIKNPTVELIEHIIQTHWPIHCVLCKKVFNSPEDLFIHGKCTPTIAVYNSPTVAENNKEYDSPPITALFGKDGTGKKYLDVLKNLATSTPMQVNGDTSVDINPFSLSSVNKTEGDKNYCETPNQELSKRKVTFCETVSVEYIDPESSHNQPKGQNQQHSPAKNISSPVIVTPTIEYQTANTEIQEPQLQVQEEKVGSPNCTLWESATDTSLMDSSANHNDEINIFKVPPVIDKFAPASTNSNKVTEKVNLSETYTDSPEPQAKRPKEADEDQNIFASTHIETSGVFKNVFNQNYMSNENLSSIKTDVDKETSHKQLSSIKCIYDGDSSTAHKSIQSSMDSEIPAVDGSQTKDKGLWSSVRKKVKDVIISSIQELAGNSKKRSYSDDDDDDSLTSNRKEVKFLKFSDIKGRKPIRDLNVPIPVNNQRKLTPLKATSLKENVPEDPPKQIKKGIDKWTQTDF